MKRSIRRLGCALLLCLSAQAGAGDPVTPPPPFEVPAWAFPGIKLPPAQETVLDDRVALGVPGSSRTYTEAALGDFFAPPDWFPDRHPPMPDSVARGREPSAFACAYCHLPDGTGRPENAALAGLPAEYIEAQVAAMKRHDRQRAWTGPTTRKNMMVQVAEAATEDEVRSAAEYFARLPMWRKTDVIESDRVPRTREPGAIYFLGGDGDEPLGQRLIEVPVDSARHLRRDPYVTYRAYVPPGSVERGRLLATTGGGRTIACVTCHGPGLRGAGVFPPLAGRSPSYLLRQLLAFRVGTRAASAGAAMQPVVVQLDIDDMIAVAAYAATLEP